MARTSAAQGPSTAVARALPATPVIAAAPASANSFTATVQKAGASTRPGGLTATERMIAGAVDVGAEEGIALLERLVNINSGTMNFEGVQEVGKVLRAELDALGFQTRWVDGAPFGRAGHLVAERTGQGPRTLLIGHLDTVFEPSSHDQKFERVGDSMARGAGITDMKGGNVVMVQALKALAAVGELDRMSLTVIFSGDEEAAGSPIELSKADLIAAADRSQYAVGFEDGDGDPTTATVARRGSTSWALDSEGKAAHSSLIGSPDIGWGAVYESARVLNEMRENLGPEDNLTVNPAFVLGGNDLEENGVGDAGSANGKTNIVAKHVRVHGDIRALSPDQLEATKERIRTIAADSLPQTETALTIEEEYPPLPLSEGNLRLLGMYDRVSQELGFGAVRAGDAMKAGAADISFTSGHLSSAIDAIGLPGSGGHTEEEIADLSMFAPVIKRAAIFLHRLSQG